MRNHEDILDIKNFLPEKKADGNREQILPAPVTKQLHQDFGNGNIQEALAGKGGAFHNMIQGMMTMETSNMTMGTNSSASGFLGNMGIQRLIMRKALSGGRAGEKLPDAQDSRVQNIKQSGGSALPTALLGHLNSIFQHDFSHVRIHTSGRDNSSASAVNSHAFTVGNHIYFNAGEYNPGTTKGMETLTHELTHVVQHDEGRIPTSTEGLEVSNPSASIEREAYKMGEAVSAEYGGFQAAEARHSIDAASSLFDDSMPEAIANHMSNQMPSSEAMTLDRIIMDAMQMANPMQQNMSQGSHGSSQNTSNSRSIMREARPIHASGTTNPYQYELTHSTPSPQTATLPSTISIDAGELGQLSARKQRNGTYKIAGTGLDLIFTPARLTKSGDGWQGEITYTINPASNRIFQYSLLGERTASLTVGEDGVGRLTVPDVDKAEIRIGGLGKVTIENASFDQGGFAGRGVFTPSDECFCYLKDALPDASVVKANITVSRSNGEWDASGSMELHFAVGDMDILSVTVTMSNGENGPTYSVEGELSLGSSVSDESTAGNANVTGVFGVDGEGNNYFRVSGEVSATQLIAPSEHGSKFMPTEMTGSARVGFDTQEGFFASGTLGASLQLPFGEEPWNFSGTLDVSEEGGITITGRVSGEKEVTLNRLRRLGGSMDVKLTGESVWDVESSKWKSTVLALEMNIGDHISGTGNIRYNGASETWQNDVEIEGSMNFQPFGEEKKIPDPAIDIASMVPKMKYPVFGPIVLEVFVDGEAGIELKPPEFDFGVKAGLNLNSATRFLDSLTVTGSVDMGAKAYANASVHAGVGVDVILASAGAGIYGELGAEANANVSANVELDLLRNGVNPEGGFNLTELNADISMDALIYGEIGLYAYVDTLFTSKKQFEYPFGRVDIAKWGPVTAGLELKQVDDKLEMEAQGLSGYDQFDFSPLKNAVHEGIDKLKDLAGHGKGTDVNVVLRNNNYQDEECPELYVKINGHESDGFHIPRGGMKSFTMNAKSMSDRVGVKVMDSDRFKDDKVIDTHWASPFAPMQAGDNGVSVRLELEEEDE